MNTKTPRTDAFLFDRMHLIHRGVVADFARQLERDLNEARKEAEKCRDEFYIFTLTWCSSPKKKLPWEKDEP